MPIDMSLMSVYTECRGEQTNLLGTYPTCLVDETDKRKSAEKASFHDWGSANISIAALEISCTRIA